MSSSKVYSSVLLADTKVPVGTEDFVVKYRQKVEDSSEIGQRIKALEAKHQQELQDAYARGREEGNTAATEVGRQQLQQFEAQFRQVMQEMLSYRDTLYKESKQQLLELTFKLADTILQARGDTEKNAVLETIDRCLNQILDKSKLKLRVHPSQVEYVQGHIDELKNLGTINSIITVDGDPRVTAGGCIIETDSGSADGTLESQLEILKDQLTKLET